MSYDSPLLPLAEIITSFKESNISITENDLKNPDPLRWHGIYSQMFEALVCVTIDAVCQSFTKVERMKAGHHELFGEAFNQMAFTSCLQRCFNNIGFTSFSIKDVIQPHPKRVQRIASVFLNAARHNQIRRAYSDVMLENIMKSQGEFENVIKHNKKLKALLTEAKETQSERNAEFQMVQAEFEHGQQIIIELNKLQEEERRSMEELKLRIARRDTEKDNMRQQLTGLQAETEKMSHKIVQSPKRFRKELERHREKVDDMKAELGKKEQALSETRLLLEQTVNKLSGVEKAVKLSKEVQVDQDKENEVEAEIRGLTEGLHELKESYTASCSQEEDLCENLRVRQEQKHKIMGQIDNRDKSTYQQLADLKQQRDKRNEKIAGLKSKISQTTNTTASLNSEIADLDRLVNIKNAENERELMAAAAEISSLQEFISQEWAEFKSILLHDDE